jgi:hypothetical protein
MTNTDTTTYRRLRGNRGHFVAGVPDAAESSQSKARRPRDPNYRRPRFVEGLEVSRHLDLRTIMGRRISRLIRTYLAELGGNASDADKALVLRLAILEAHIIKQTDGRAGVLTDEIIRMSSEHRRLLISLRGPTKNQAKPSSAPTMRERLLLEGAA